MDDLQKQIDDNEQKLKSCGKYDYVCQAKYKAIIVSLQAAKATADAALSAAQAVLQAAQDELAKIPDPDVDPQIIGWKAEVVADQLAVQSADGTIGGLEKLIDFANQVVQAGPGEPQSAVSARAPSQMPLASIAARPCHASKFCIGYSHSQNDPYRLPTLPSSRIL